MSVCRFIPIELHAQIREYRTHLHKFISFLKNESTKFCVSFILCYANLTVRKISEVYISN